MVASSARRCSGRDALERSRPSALRNQSPAGSRPSTCSTAPLSGNKASIVGAMRRSPHHLISGRHQATTKLPHAAVRGHGLQGGWDPSHSRRLAAKTANGRTSTLDRYVLLSSASVLAALHLLESSAGRHHTRFKVAPERNQQLARQRHNGDAPDPSFETANTLMEPDTQSTVELVTRP
jgi:hypothetical protein